MSGTACPARLELNPRLAEIPPSSHHGREYCSPRASESNQGGFGTCIDWIDKSNFYEGVYAVVIEA